MDDFELGSVCDLKAGTLQSVLKFLTEEEINSFCRYLEHRKWPADAVLMDDGEEGDYMGFVLQGKLSVKKETSFPGKFTLVAILDVGSMVGEISAVEKGRRTATVVAMEDCELLVLTCESLDSLLQDDSQLGIKVLKRIIHILSIRQQKAYDRLSWLL